MTPRGELQLQQRLGLDDRSKPVYEIIYNGVFLMASYNELSERRLATLAIEPLASQKKGIRVLIGGLGIGYTLRAALDCKGVQAVDVVEIEEYIVKWARSFFRELNGYACSDKRVNLLEMDLWDYLRKTEKTYNAIIFDLDNGPTWLSLASNERLYEKSNLSRIKELLGDKGVFTVWAAQKSATFLQRLEAIFGRTELITVQDRERENRLTEYFIYRARL